MVFDRLKNIAKSEYGDYKDRKKNPARKVKIDVDEYEPSYYSDSFDAEIEAEERKHQYKQQTEIDMNEKEYYEVLEVAPGSSFTTIRKAYLKMMKDFHPDRFPNDPEKKAIAQQVCSSINEAFEYFEKKFGK